MANNFKLKFLVVLMGIVIGSEASVIPSVPVAPVVPATYYDPHPQYSYAYNVHDTLTGDAKSQYETRDGNVVKGSYSLIEADGTRRIVTYTADSINGFNAVVHREPAVIKAPAVIRPALPPPPSPILLKTPNFHQHFY